MENQPHSPVGNLERTSKTSLGHTKCITGTKNMAKSRLGAREGFTLETYHEMLSKQSRDQGNSFIGKG